MQLCLPRHNAGLDRRTSCITRHDSVRRKPTFMINET